jgi:hypothetical protein
MGKIALLQHRAQLGFRKTTKRRLEISKSASLPHRPTRRDLRRADSKTKHFPGHQSAFVVGKMSGNVRRTGSQTDFTNTLSAWIKEVIVAYPGLTFNNFTSSFQNGYVTPPFYDVSPPSK